MTDARTGGVHAQAAVNVDPTTVHGRTAGVHAQAAVSVDTTTVHGRTAGVLAQAAVVIPPVDARVAGVLVQVAVQVKRGYITDFQGNPLRAWSGGSTYPVLAMG